MLTQPVLKQTGFYQLFAQTIIWTAVNIFFHVDPGRAAGPDAQPQAARPDVYRALLILPWAIPAFASLQIWRTEFNFQYGAVNQVLGLFGIAPVPWLSDPFCELRGHDHHQCLAGRAIHDGHHPGRPAEHLAGLLRGGRDRRRHARTSRSGASRCRCSSPSWCRPILLGTFLTFNNILVPFFINQNELETSDILVTALYRAAFQYSRFGFAAAFAFVIFAILMVFTIFYVRKTNALKGAYE